MSRDTEDLRHEIESSRERMSDTLDQLGDRLNPSRIKLQVKENIREATVGRVATMARNAADRVNHTRDGVLDTIRDNPIPAAMIGIGLGWILFNGRRGRTDTQTFEHAHDLPADSSYTGTGYVGDITATTPRLQQDDAAGGLGASSISHDGGSGVVDRVRDRVSGVAEHTTERIGDVAQRVTHVASDVAQSTRYQAHRVEDRLSRTLENNPLAVGAVALAVGMAAGLVIPETTREREMMGPARDRLTDRAREVAGIARERAQEVAQRVVDEVSTGNTGDTDGAML